MEDSELALGEGVPLQDGNAAHLIGPVALIHFLFRSGLRCRRERTRLLLCPCSPPLKIELGQEGKGIGWRWT